MRIIAGRHRGRTLLAPEDEKTTRPITDRVKETLFNRLHSLGMLEGPSEGGNDWRALDIFAGTGSLGLECISRGAAHVLFIDRDRGAVRRLEQNLASLGEADRATVLHTSALIPTWAARLRDPVRLVFLDPPYAMMEDDATRESLARLMDSLLPHLEDGGVLILRTPRETAPLDVSDYDGPASFTYGSMALHFYQRPMEEAEGEEGETAMPA